MKNNLIINSIIIFILLLSLGCKKDFLDDKPSTNIVQPVTLDNMIGLLDNSFITFSSPALPIVSADEYHFVDYQTWQAAITVTERNAYIWAKDIYEGEQNIRDWSAPYASVFYANNVLSALKNIPITKENIAKRNLVEGWALFVRAESFYNLANNFCKAYDSTTANVDLGIPIRLSPEIDVIEQRSTLKQTYDRILADLNHSKILLASSAVLPTDKKNRPSVVASYGLLARIYLNMGDYSNAELYADSCLNLYPNLINYQSVIPSTFPFAVTNEETLYSTAAVNAYSASSCVYNDYINIDSTLLSSYKTGDLRVNLLFTPANGGMIANGNYLGPSVVAYTGIATDEIYLIKAECAARRGDIVNCLKKLNELLVKRYTPSAFVPLTATTQKQALDLVLLERRKELVWRGLRWLDLKRLNREGAGIELKRVLNGITYTLLPNDPKYIFPIPSDEIAYTGIVQNQR